MEEIRPEPKKPHEGHHRSARERQRKGPMWGCLKAMVLLFGGVFLVLFLVIGGGWWYLGTSSFAGFIRLRIENTLETKLGREVTIGSVEVIRTRPQRVILRDLRIANAPGAVSPYFATVREVEIAGGISSLWNRVVRVGRIDIRDPKVYFEIYPEGGPLVHNFPQWQSGPRGKYQIYQLILGRMFVTGGGFLFLDRRHEISAEATNLTSNLTITSAENLYEGSAESPLIRVKIQDYAPFDLDLRGGFRYTPGILALKSIALTGRDMRVFLSGQLNPLTEGVYNLRLRSEIGLDRVREIFRVEKALEGTLALDTNLRGRQGDFAMTGGWSAPRILADVYELTNARGQLNVTDEKTVVDVESARYGGGTVKAHYLLTQYAEPYPMNVELRYNGVSLEKLFADWGMKQTGLRGGATGRLTYRWEKDRVLEGSGTGTAALGRNAGIFSNAPYPVALTGGNADFDLDRGVVKFRDGELRTEANRVGFRGSIRIEDLNTDLAVAINSSDFAELDRIAFNFARSADKKDYKLLGLGGAGQITGTVRGPIKTPVVVAHVSGSGAKYNNVLLGAADLDIHYEGPRDLLTFDKAIFRDGNARISLAGTLTFPSSGPSPRFDIAIDALSFPADRAVKSMDLPLKVSGLGTGKMLVTGTPESGKVTFAGMTIRQKDAELQLRGDVAWLPGEGNTVFDLDIGAQSFPVGDIIAFLDLGTLPVSGELTGKLHLEGPKKLLEGAGAVTVRNGLLYGEPIDVASADIAFEKGKLKATNLNVVSPAGQVTGQAELDLGTEQFSYSIESGGIDLSKVKAISAIAGLFGGRLTIKSTGAGTFTNPELVVEATLNDAAVRGLAFPPDSPPPTFYLAIRNNRLIIRGSAANAINIEGDGAVGPELAIDGLVRITISDLARALALSPNTATLNASGNAVIDLKLGGKLAPIEALRIEGTVPTFDLKLGEHEFTAPQPLRFSLRDGRVVFDSFTLQHGDAPFSIAGFAEITGEQRLNVSLRGEIEAALLQLFVPDTRAEGHINVAADVRGTLKAPSFNGTAELRDARVRFAGFPQIIDNITGTLVFKEDRVDIDSLRATLGGGTVVAGGFIALEGLVPKSIRIAMQGTDVALRYFEGVTIEGNFNLVLSGDLERTVLQGDVNVTRGLYFRDFVFESEILNALLSKRAVTPVVAASWQDRVSLRVHLSAPGTLAVRNNIADVTGSGELDLTGTLANPVVLGEVNLDEGGTVRFQKIDYRLVRGSINFQNPFRIDPYFDVTLEGRVSSGFSDVEAGPIDVTINLTGTIDRFTPTITSEPPASDITLFSILGFGGLGGARTGAEQPGAGLYGRSLITQSVFSLLGSRILPFADSFSYDPGLLDTTNDPGAKVSFEKRVSNSIRLLVVYNIDNGESREVVEWQATRDWTLQLTRDEHDSEYRVEGRFRRRYDARWTWGRRGRPLGLSASIGSIAGAVPPEKAPLPTTATQLTMIGRPVVSINFRSDALFETETVRQYVELRPERPLSIRDLQNSIKNLFTTGDFRDVRVDAAPSGDGVNVTFSLFLQYRVGKIEWVGITGRERTRAERELTIRQGDVLSLDAINDSAAAIQAELQRNGYLEATVDTETIFDRPTSRANVILTVDPGPRARVGRVAFEGDLRGIPETELIQRIRSKPKEPFVLQDARGDADRIRNFLVNKEYRRAEVRFIDDTYDASSNLVTLQYRVNVGPIVKVEVEGVPRNEVRRLLPFRRNQAYSEDLIDQASTRIVQRYQERGYFNAAVDTESGIAGDVWVTKFVVNPGPHYKLAEVKFTGNIKVRDDKLRKVVSTGPRGGIGSLLARLLRRPTGVTTQQLSDDRDALESFYRLEGFSEATVATPVPQPRADGTLAIEFPIVEGPQTLVSEITLEGIAQVQPKRLPRLQLRPGKPFNPQLLREDLVALQSFYADRGNAEVQITPRTDISADKTSAKVTYVIAEGPRVEIGDVVVRGNAFTNTEVIQRSSGLNEGRPFSYTSVLEAQRNLYRMGIFRRVDVQPEQAGTSLADRNVLLQVEEGKNLTLSGSVGLSIPFGSGASAGQISPRVAVSAAHRNLFGTGRYLGLELTRALGAREQTEAFLTYREPFIRNFNVPVQLTIFQSEDRTSDRHLRQRGTFIEASRVAQYRTRWSLRYEYKISDCIETPAKDDLCSRAQEALIPGLDRSALDIKISSIAPTFFWDRRDDVINPHRGFFTSASVEYAFKFFNADANFTKEFVQGSWYLPLTERSVIALAGRVGLIQRLARDPDTDELLPVPLSERFTSGGDTSHRAFDLDLLGTLCSFEEIQNGCISTLTDVDPDPNKLELAPIGGNAVLVLNAEYRFPIYSTLGGALFVDAGNVYAERIELRNLRYGVGTGLRYLSPVGPLRLDVAYKINRRFYENPFEFFITLGYAF